MKFSLQDRFTLDEGTIALSGIQALVRLPLDQHRADKAAGLNTATFVSGYRGSPVGTLDTHFQQHKALMDEHQVHVMPAVNEDLGATAVWGSQMANLYPNPKYDGVLGMWYGKGPGLDRSGDAIKHANYTGVGKHGGVLAVTGDDPISKSSTIPSHSEIALYELSLPILYPGNVQEILELGRYGFELSRYCGSWVGFKIVTNVADAYSTARLQPTPPIERPHFEYNGLPWQPSQEVKLLAPFVLEIEREIHEARTEAAALFGAANNLNKVITSTNEDWIGLVAAGKTYYDLREALATLGFTDERLRQRGVRLIKLGMIYPLDRGFVREFSRGLQEIFVIEEKRGFVEGQIRDILFNLAEHPLVVGKRNEEERFLVRADSELDADQIAPLLIKRLGRRLDANALKRELNRAKGRDKRTPAEISLSLSQPPLNRTPYFCSGCPHNRSTNLPDGALFGAGIGCHGMVMLMNPNTTGITHMGGEGVQWVGAAPFSGVEHIFQNLGDGTLFHSGYLAIRQAVASGTNITYKILYNNAVAMTGGQVADGEMDIPELTRALHAEGVNRIIVCTHDLDKYPRGTQWAPGIDIWHRDRMDHAQELLRDESGVTVLIYDQPCAADMRRKRKRGEAETPPQQIFINEAVCEGCGDCGVKSNCLSVVPVETEFGRKTQIHQSSCNRDYTCLEGDCPAFVTIEGGVTPVKKARNPQEIDVGELPAPPNHVNGQPPASGNVFMTGIGGTGVVTVNQILATAALLDGKQTTSLDQTGLSQKGGAVLSHLKVADGEIDGSNLIGDGDADAYLVFDILGGAAEKNLQKAHPDKTVAIVSSTKTPTGAMVKSTEVHFPEMDGLHQRIDAHTVADENIYLDATSLAEQLFGSHMPGNMLIVGAAYQAGILPLSAESIEEAIALNGVAVAMNQVAFRVGRKLAVEPTWTPEGQAQGQPKRAGEQAIPHSSNPAAQALISGMSLPNELQHVLEIRVPELIEYQSEGYARQYVDFVDKVRATENRDENGDARLSEAVARNLFKLMAYKDEYEVARLHLKPEFREAMAEQFGADAEVKYQLHPPLLKALGLKKKIALGRWFDKGFELLTKLKRLRGTPLDIFGYGKVRRVERQLIHEYRALIEGQLDGLNGGEDKANYEQAVALAQLPDMIRGYEEVKLGNVEKYKEKVKELLG